MKGLRKALEVIGKVGLFLAILGFAATFDPYAEGYITTTEFVHRFIMCGGLAYASMLAYKVATI